MKISSLSILIIVALIFFALVIAQIAVKAKRPVFNAIIGIFTGVFTLAAVNITSLFTGVALPVSLLTIGISAILGIPGVTMLLFLQMLI